MKSTRTMGRWLIVLLFAGCAGEPAVSEKETAKQPAAEPPSRAVEPAQPAADSGEPSGDAAEWPGWRGPHGDGSSPEVPRRLPPKKLLWSQPMAGECHAPVSVGGGRVLVADHGNERDYWRCFDATDGTPVWTYEYANAEEMDFGAAPRAAPRIYRGKAYCLNAWGELFCLELAGGNVGRKKHLAREFQQQTPTRGHSCPPRAADEKLSVKPGGPGGPAPPVCHD